jgi:hypothetical protein
LPVHDFIAKEWNKIEVDFEKWAKKLWYFTVLQNIRKSLYEAVEVVITKFLSPNLAKGGAYAILPRHRSRTRCQKPGRNSRFFWILG